MSLLQDLKATSTLQEVASLLEIPPSMLAYLLYKLPATAKYTTFVLAKKNGGFRTIDAPIENLGSLQKSLSNLLLDCIDEINEERRRAIAPKNLYDPAHGFVRGRCIHSNAFQHTSRRHVFNLDLADFFPSINFGRVRGFFLKNKHFALSEKTATIISQISCHGDVLPQGSPCSPVISNLVAHILDMKIVRLAAKHGLTYTRYADDLTFSTNKRDFPQEVASLNSSGVWDVGKELAGIIEHSGFVVNTAKTRMQLKNSRQVVTGLVVNDRVNITSEYRKRIRAMADHLFRKGDFFLPRTSPQAPETIGTLNQLHGMLAYVEATDEYSRKSAQLSKNGPAQKRTAYSRFLYYKEFYRAQLPVILCEGQTDNVYLRHAMKSLLADYPRLCEEISGKKLLKVRLFPYKNSSTSRILRLSGGSSLLSSFALQYLSEAAQFSPQGENQPVILILDNDSGGDGFCKAIKNKTKLAVNKTAPFTHIAENLYAVLTPLGKNSESKIEDFFDEATLKVVIDSKTFNVNDKADTSKHFGKVSFANFISTNAGNVSFDGFRPLLSRILLVMDDHNQKVSGNPTIQI